MWQCDTGQERAVPARWGGAALRCAQRRVQVPAWPTSLLSWPSSVITESTEIAVFMLKWVGSAYCLILWKSLNWYFRRVTVFVNYRNYCSVYYATINLTQDSFLLLWSFLRYALWDENWKRRVLQSKAAKWVKRNMLLEMGLILFPNIFTVAII